MKISLFRPFIICSFIINLISMSASSQQPIKNYTAEWKKVEAFKEKGLPKSALEEVKKIYALAKKDKQDAQLIKSLVYMATLQNENREDNATTSMTEIEKEIVEGQKGKETANAILKSLLAEMYWNYFQNNRWKIYDRTQTAKYTKTDPATWDVNDFHKRISELYLQSIQPEGLLQQTKLTAYEAIITKGNVRQLRPTLFDLLAHRALQYFQNDERDISKPAYAFEISQASAFDPAADFVKRKFPTKDSSSLQHKALLIYQQLISLHLRDAKPDALLDADLLRLEYVKNKSTHPDEDKLYFNAINHIANQYGNTPAAAQAWYLMAAYYNEKAGEYRPYGDSTHRFDKLKAKEICEKVLQQKDSSEGRINCYNLLNEIKRKSFQFSLEKVNVPGQPFRSLVKYNNISNLYFRLIRMTEDLKKQLEEQYSDKYWPALINAKAEKSWEQNLPDTKDHQQHGTEIMIGALPAGEYILLGSDSRDFKASKKLLGARMFYVSNISYVNSSNDYFVLNRDNGRPLAKATVQVWEQRYDYNSSKNIREKGKSYTTDANGFFRMEKKKREPNNYGSYTFLMDISHQSDRLFMNDYSYDYYYNNQETEEPKNLTSVHLFTDRSIYRPGQTVYFKGIVLTRNTREKTGGVKANYATNVVLRDANYKEIDTIPVLTNEYGSFSGKFQLPQSGLNGQFTIMTKTDNGNAQFRVEEYKRPKFYVDYEPIKGTYEVNDKITVTGLAKAYAGNNVDGAMVKYRVVREPRFLYSWMFWRWWQPPTEEMEIVNGEVVTDKDGKFKIEFTAIPDLSIDKKFEPVFDYRVYADVTDINGETRSGEKTVSVSYKSLILQTSIPARMPADSLKKLNISTRNMNGEFEPANISVVISPLKAENRLIRDRLWERPDQFVMSKDAYIRNFPYDEYDNEADFKSWEKNPAVFSKNDSSRMNGQWPVVHSGFSPGFYAVEVIAKDKKGQEVKDIRYIELYDDKSKKLSKPEYLWTGNLQTNVEAGKTAQVELGTAADSLFVVHQINKETSNKETNYKFLELSNQKEKFSFNTTEADKGGFGANWMFVKHNRFFQLSQTISIPWTDKNLGIEYVTYRDKTLPGSEEKWKIRITGYQKEKLAAEMLATMYDASLDQFYSHSWGSPSIWPYFYNNKSWSGSMNFNQLQSQQKNENFDETLYVDKRYDYLFSENLSFFEDRRMFRLAKNAPAPGMVENDAVVTSVQEEAEEKSVAKDLMGKVPGVQIAKKDGDGLRDQTDTRSGGSPSGDVKIRKNFNETAFFFPDLRTDSTGAIEFSFTMPEALTKWKFMALAHTKEAAFGNSTKEIVTQKELMVQPNPPRFLREGDKMEFSAKVVNLTAKEMTGTAEFQLFDAATNEPVDGRFRSTIPNQYFTVGAGQSESIKFPIEVPYQFNKALVWRIVVKSGAYSDGEENALPVLTNRMLVTESMPLPMRGTGTRNFSFDKLLKSGNSESLQHHAITVEYTSNPAWYAVQALPYLMEYPYECAEQTWNRYYANSLATFIANSSPRIKQVFERWRIKDTAALMSNLQKNQELKAVLLEETPWVLQAKNEAEQKRNIALLFDMVRMSEQLNSTYDKLKQMQSSNGGFVWFSGGPDDRYITQYIVTGIGHLLKLKAAASGHTDKLKAILQKAIPYLDRKIKEDYDDLIKYKVSLKTYTPGYTTIQYLYMRSFFPEYPIATASKTAYDYFRGRTQQTWVGQSKYMQGMISLAMHRTNDAKTTAAILKSLKETAIINEELGMYWKDQTNGWFWYQAPIETQALLIEAFQEAGKDEKAVDDLRTWLLKNKQTNNWKTTRATAEACYALLLQGAGPAAIGSLTNEPLVEIKMGNLSIKSSSQQQEAGSGYFKQTIEGNKVEPQMGNISVTVSSPSSGGGKGEVGATWGAAYWQYFEDLDKITTAATPLKLVKKLFVEKNSDRGPVLTPVNDGDVLKVGDKIKVRVELRVDRDMEYVHMKDMRASALEPVNVLSQYKWQGGLGYYESTKDASTNFFFSYLRKGTYVFEYPLFVTHTGNFSNGITSIQCMYAPEFSSHSEGVRITVE